jgi:hypothetical protein
MVFQMFGVEWVMLRWVVDLLACWNMRVCRNDIIIVWNAISSFFIVAHLGRKERSKVR